MVIRCSWCVGSSLYENYHDFEWGIKIVDDRKLFEALILETQQAGLSFITILKKRENYRKLFDDFNYNLISKYNEEKIKKIYLNSGIIRHKLKLISIVKNSKVYILILEEFGSFENYLNQFIVKDLDFKDISNLVSKDLKNRGMTFIGPIIIYSFFEATGFINNHEIKCFKFNN